MAQAIQYTPLSIHRRELMLALQLPLGRCDKRPSELDRQVVSDDMAPTSLNEGRGEMTVPVVAVGLNLNCYLGTVVVRGQAGSPNAERRDIPFREGAQNTYR